MFPSIKLPPLSNVPDVQARPQRRWPYNTQYIDDQARIAAWFLETWLYAAMTVLPVLSILHPEKLAEACHRHELCPGVIRESCLQVWRYPPCYAKRVLL